MKKYLFQTIFIALLFISAHISFAQPPITNTNWNKWKSLLGDWVGEESGKPGQWGGAFSFAFDLEGKIIVRKNHSEYPGGKQTPEMIHDDLLIVYADSTRILNKAIYFDSEGHVINYAIIFSEKDTAITFTSDAAAQAPRFRLSYTLLNSESVNIKFEFAPPGKPNDFKTYLEGKAFKKK